MRMAKELKRSRTMTTTKKKKKRKKRWIAEQRNMVAHLPKRTYINCERIRETASSCHGG